MTSGRPGRSAALAPLVVERSLARLSKCRGILIRWEKKPANYRGLLELACGLSWFRRYHPLTAA